MTYTLLFLLFGLSTLMLMKLVAYLIARRSTEQVDARFFYMTPILCPETHGESFDIKIKNSDLIFDLAFSTFMLILAHNYINILLEQFPNFKLALPYILMFFIYLFTQFLGANFRIIASLFKLGVPAIHNKPFLSKSLTEFWGQRWNIWVRNWLRFIGKYLVARNIKLRYLVIFLISGLFHELMVNLPYYFYTGDIIFGSMILYFLIQYFGLICDKKFFKKTSVTRILFMYLVLLAPAPLFINKAVILFFGFY